MKNVNARVSDKTETFLGSHFRTRSAGAEYMLAAWQAASRKYVGIDMKGKFTPGELRLMIDVMNGTILSPEMAGQRLAMNVSDGMELDAMDEKWGVDAEQINYKLSTMSTPELMILEIWIQGFWQAVTDRNQGLEEYIQVAL